jgi:WD40 repeat protein
VASGGIVDVWNVEGPIRLICSLRGHLPASVYVVAFSSDGLYLASGGTDRALRLWDRATGQEIRAFYGHEGFVSGLAFSPDSQWLVSASDDSSLKLWEVASGRSLADFHGHQSFAGCVAFSPDGQLIASGGLDRAVKLWSATRRAPLTFTGHDPDGGAVYDLEFLPKSQRLVSGASYRTTRGQLKLWDPTTGDVHQIACPRPVPRRGDGQGLDLLGALATGRRSQTARPPGRS